MSKAKKIKVEKPDEPEKKMPEEQSVQPDQVDHTYGRKSDGGEVAMAESQFLRSLHEAAGRLLADPAGKFDHRAALRDTALMLSAGVDVAGRQGLSPLLLLLLLFLHLLLLLHLLILLLRLHLHLQDGGAACRRGCVPDRALLHK